MVVIDSFDFDFSGTRPKIVAVVSRPDKEWAQELAITEAVIGTQKVYSKETDDFDFSKDSTVPYLYHVLYINPEIGEDNKWRFELVIDGDNVKESDLFFIRITDNTEEILTEEVPCGMDSKITWSATYDNFSVDTKGMQYIKELTTNCTIPTGMIDYIINKEALDVAAGCGDYSTMVDRYEDLMNITYTSTSTAGANNNYKICGCNG